LGLESWFECSWEHVLSASECAPDELYDRVDTLTATWPSERAWEIMQTKRSLQNA
jgi:hypothetical protein